MATKPPTCIPHSRARKSPAMKTYDVRLKSNGNYWQACWLVEGKRQVRSLGPKADHSRRQANTLCRQLAVDLQSGKRTSGTAPLLSEWLATYKTLVAHDTSEGTKDVVEFTGRLLAAYFDNDPPIDKISRLDAAHWAAEIAKGELAASVRVYPKKAEDVKPATRYQQYRKVLEKNAGAKILSAASVAKYVRCAKRIFSEATEDHGVGLIVNNPFRRLNGRAPSPEKDWAQIGPKDMEAILDACPNDGWRALFVLCRWAGLRRGEAMDLEWGDVIWDRNRINVNARVDIVTTKKKPRICPIDPPKCPAGLAAKLGEYHQNAGEGIKQICQGVDLDNIDKIARSIILRAGVAAYDKPFHALRKNRAGEVARAGYPLNVHCAWLGHSIEVAQAYYLRVEEEDYFMPPAEKAQGKAQTATSDSTN